uniref:Uncharacterized protein n=1 Tax=Rhizophora mucronata TaxID=61149 RepID=A0A2P2NVZ3_RHIMU
MILQRACEWRGVLVNILFNLGSNSNFRQGNATNIKGLLT